MTVLEGVGWLAVIILALVLYYLVVRLGSLAVFLSWFSVIEKVRKNRKEVRNERQRRKSKDETAVDRPSEGSPRDGA